MKDDLKSLGEYYDYDFNPFVQVGAPPISQTRPKVAAEKAKPGKPKAVACAKAPATPEVSRENFC